MFLIAYNGVSSYHGLKLKGLNFFHIAGSLEGGESKQDQCLNHIRASLRISWQSSSLLQDGCQGAVHYVLAKVHSKVGRRRCSFSSNLFLLSYRFYLAQNSPSWVPLWFNWLILGHMTIPRATRAAVKMRTCIFCLCDGWWALLAWRKGEQLTMSTTNNLPLGLALNLSGSEFNMPDKIWNGSHESIYISPLIAMVFSEMLSLLFWLIFWCP